MKKTNPIIALIIFMCFCSRELSAQKGYSDFKTMTGRIQALAKEYPSVCDVSSLTKTAGGKEIWLITIGTGDKDNKPGVAIFGGLEGSHITGMELAAGIAESMVRGSSSDEMKQLLGEVTFYVFPNVSPDATEQFFSTLKFERNVNARPTDDDRDFETDEDPSEDMDKDGYITFVRVEDPSGKYTKHTEDERVMVEADIAEGKTGSYLYFTEGFDNDRDKEFNEDGAGGVNFNSNFSYNYEEFGPGSGLHPVSEPETRAVADFLFDRFNIYAVFSFGPQDNLGQPMKAADQTRSERRITSIMKSDESINKLVSDKYHEITGIKGVPRARNSPGNFMEWAYYHYGRYSFCTPAWWFPVEKGKNAEAEFLKFSGKDSLNEVFIPWKEIRHPDFPDRKAEAGGIKPFAMINPPTDSLSALVEKNFRFITAIAAMHPELEFTDVVTEKAGDDIFRITVKVRNIGIFATVAEAGEVNSWTRIMRISAGTAKGQEILSGRKVQRIGRLTGGQFAEFSWLVSGRGPVKITAGAANTGVISTTINLK